MSKQLKILLVTWVVCFVIILNYFIYIIDKSDIYVFVFSLLAPIVPSIVVYIIVDLLLKKKEKRKKDPIL